MTEQVLRGLGDLAHQAGDALRDLSVWATLQDAQTRAYLDYFLVLAVWALCAAGIRALIRRRPNPAEERQVAYMTGYQQALRDLLASGREIRMGEGDAPCPAPAGPS